MRLTNRDKMCMNYMNWYHKFLLPIQQRIFILRFSN